MKKPNTNIRNLIVLSSFAALFSLSTMTAFRKEAVAVNVQTDSASAFLSGDEIVDNMASTIESATAEAITETRSVFSEQTDPPW